MHPKAYDSNTCPNDDEICYRMQPADHTGVCFSAALGFASRGQAQYLPKRRSRRWPSRPLPMTRSGASAPSAANGSPHRAGINEHQEGDSAHPDVDPQQNYGRQQAEQHQPPHGRLVAVVVVDPSIHFYSLKRRCL